MHPRHQPPPPPDDDWDRGRRKIAAFCERLLAAGWIDSYSHGPAGLRVNYTPAGAEKMGQMLKLCHEMGLPAFNADETYGWLLFLQDNIAPGSH